MDLKFPIIMPDGTKVATLEELREHFDLGTVVKYYIDGRLVMWLNGRFHEDEAQKIEALDPTSENFMSDLCDILGVPCPDVIDDEQMLKRALKRNRLKQLTADDDILKAVDWVAFTQDELNELACKQNRYQPTETFSQSSEAHRKTIYLCGEHFILPSGESAVTYVGVNHPCVYFGEGEIAPDIELKDVEVNLDRYIKGVNAAPRFRKAFRRNPDLGISLLEKLDKNGSTDACAVLGNCYLYGFGKQKEDAGKAIKLLERAADSENADAQADLGHCYRYGKGCEKDLKRSWYWSQEAAEQGNSQAQIRIGIFYEEGCAFEKDTVKAVEWYKKAAEAGDPSGQYHLGRCYYESIGVRGDKEIALNLLREAERNGIGKATPYLIQLKPREYSLSQVLLQAVGGKDNVDSARLDRTSGEVVLRVKQLADIKVQLLKDYGASDVRKEPDIKLYTKDKHKVPKAIKKVMNNGWLGPVGHEAAKLFPDFDKKKGKKELKSGFVSFRLHEISNEMVVDFNWNVAGHDE